MKHNRITKDEDMGVSPMIMVVIDLYLWMIKILITSLFIFVKNLLMNN